MQSSVAIGHMTHVVHLTRPGEQGTFLETIYGEVTEQNTFSSIYYLAGVADKIDKICKQFEWRKML